MEMIPIPDSLDAVEQNVRAFLLIAGEKPGVITVAIDTVSGTASIKHDRMHDGRINCTIYMPALPAATRISRVELTRWIAYFLHELCHALYTNEQVWRVAVRQGLHVLVNCLEDVRIERKFNAAAIAANSTSLLTDLLRWVVDKMPSDFDVNDLRNFPWVLAMTGRVQICGYDIPTALPHIAALKPALAAIVAETMRRLDKADDTQAVLEIAIWLKTVFATNAKDGDGPMTNPGKRSKHPTNPDDADDADKGDETGQGEAGEARTDENDAGKGETTPDDGNRSSDGPSVTGGNEPDDDSDDDDADADDSDAGDDAGETDSDDDSDGDGETGTGETGNGGHGHGDGNETPERNPVDDMEPVDLNPVSEPLKEIAKDEIRSDRAHDEAEIIQGIRDAQRTAGSKLRDIPDGKGNILQRVERLKHDAMKCGRLRQHVARVLKSEETETWSRGKMSGRLDRFAHGRIAAGVLEGVYTRRHIAGGYETEIIVLIDGSSSMAYRPIWAASVLAYVVAQAAQNVGVKVEVIRFSTGAFASVKTVKATPNADAVQRAFASVQSGGSTPLARSIVRAAARLAARAPNKRKLLFVVSDGDDDNGPRAVKRACDYAASRDVETVALCIDVPVHNGFAHGVSCSSSNIAEAGLGALVRVLSRHE